MLISKRGPHKPYHINQLIHQDIQLRIKIHQEQTPASKLFKKIKWLKRKYRANYIKVMINLVNYNSRIKDWRKDSENWSYWYKSFNLIKIKLMIKVILNLWLKSFLQIKKNRWKKSSKLTLIKIVFHWERSYNTKRSMLYKKYNRITILMMNFNQLNSHFKQSRPKLLLRMEWP